MARTHVEKYDKPIVVTVEEIREQCQDWLETSMADYDKAGELQDWFYYEGWADSMKSLLMWMTGAKEIEESEKKS